MIKFLGKAIEWMFMIRIALSPILLCGLIAAYLYVTAQTDIQIYTACAVAVSGIVLGVWLVIRVKRKNTATEFMARIIATPDLDKKENPEK